MLQQTFLPAVGKSRLPDHLERRSGEAATAYSILSNFTFANLLKEVLHSSQPCRDFKEAPPWHLACRIDANKVAIRITLLTLIQCLYRQRSHLPAKRFQSVNKWV
eukprot:6478980-Amphidinium_carterae.1